VGGRRPGTYRLASRTRARSDQAGWGPRSRRGPARASSRCPAEALCGDGLARDRVATLGAGGSPAAWEHRRGVGARCGVSAAGRTAAGGLKVPSVICRPEGRRLTRMTGTGGRETLGA
jgi:hypothetical protein